MKYKYWMATLEKLNSNKKLQLLEFFKSEEAIYYSSEEQLQKSNLLNKKEIDYITEKKKENMDRSWNNFLETGIGMTTVRDSDYPQELLNIMNPPYCLFYKGKLPERGKKAVSIVGARSRSSYGEHVARKIAQTMAMNGIDVISGMARGIDRDGHLGAIENDGKTYAVLGCGVNIIYPKENRFLYQKILETGGGILSEYPIDMQPQKYTFPERNRIIAALSHAVILVEAKKKSGSLITADYALEQGKDVYAVPGRITDELSYGCNWLISQGAIPVFDLDEIVKNILEIDDDKIKIVELRKNLLEKDETLVYSLTDFQPIGIDQILHQSQLEFVYLLDILENLQNKGFIKEIIPGYYVRIH